MSTLTLLLASIRGSWVKDDKKEEERHRTKILELYKEDIAYAKKLWEKCEIELKNLNKKYELNENNLYGENITCRLPRKHDTSLRNDAKCECYAKVKSENQTLEIKIDNQDTLCKKKEQYYLKLKEERIAFMKNNKK